MPLTLRELQADDAAFLVSMVVVAADWRKGSVLRETSEVMASPDLAKYAVGWPQTGDRGLVAVADDGQRLGAAWWRFLGPPAPGYGFVREEVPEVSLGVIVRHRSQGLGRSLLRGLVGLAREAGLTGLSLSVEPENYATVLYRNEGFIVVGSNGGAVTMLLDLAGADGAE